MTAGAIHDHTTPTTSATDKATATTIANELAPLLEPRHTIVIRDQDGTTHIRVTTGSPDEAVVLHAQATLTSHGITLTDGRDGPATTVPAEQAAAAIYSFLRHEHPITQPS